MTQSYVLRNTPRNSEIQRKEKTPERFKREENRNARTEVIL